MKIQDVFFILSVFPLWYFRDKKSFAWAAVLCILCAIPLFQYWVFFTAQRLTWYAAAFIGIELLRMTLLHRKEKI